MELVSYFFGQKNATCHHAKTEAKPIKGQMKDMPFVRIIGAESSSPK